MSEQALRSLMEGTAAGSRAVALHGECLPEHAASEPSCTCLGLPVHVQAWIELRPGSLGPHWCRAGSPPAAAALPPLPPLLSPSRPTAACPAAKRWACPPTSLKRQQLLEA